MKKIILASKSPQRKALLQQIGLKFRSVDSKSDEKMNPRLRPRGQVEYLSQEKAKAVIERYPDAIIIAADTVVVLDNEIIGKPMSAVHARKILEKLSGRAHQVMTGFTIIDTEKNKSVTESVVTKVYMKKLSKKDIDAYVKSGEPFEAAGAYRIQGKGSVLIERIDGDYFNVVGLPINAVCEELKKFGISIV